MRKVLTGFLLLTVIFLSACAGADPQPVFTATPSRTATSTVPPTLTVTPTRTPPALPDPYQTSLLNPLDTPHTYVSDTCQFLHNKWSSTNAVPGTVVMVIMFHSVTNDPISSANQISEYDFRQLMNALHDNGFVAITTEQLADFMESNAAIPQRSVLLTADDRHYREYFDVLFRQYWEDWGWPVVNAWISTDQSTAVLWQEQVDLQAEGWVDYQAHGMIHNIPMGPDSTDAYIYGELQGSIDRFMEHFGKRPIAIIWPGGGFAERPVEIARELDYQLGFTVNPRGPLMYNWVPLADTKDEKRPSWLPEGPVGDPLLVLPRYWDTDAIIHLPEVIQMSEEAAAYAEANKTTELDYYSIVCESVYGPIP